MIVVADSGPLIAMARIGHLLRTLYGELWVPPAVRKEVVASGCGGQGAAEVDSASWVRTVETQDTTAVPLLRERLDAGESAALVLAIEVGASLLLIDEAKGRRVAQARGLNHIGTLGTLIVAMKRGFVRFVAPLLGALVAAGFRMRPELYEAVQRLVGETAG